MMLIKSLLLPLVAAICAQAAKIGSLRSRSLLSTFDCILIEVTFDTADEDTIYEHVCLGKGDDDDYDMVYQIDDNNGKIADQLDMFGYDVENNSGRYKVTMTNVVLDKDPVVTTTPATEVTVEDLEQDDDRRLEGSVFKGKKTIAIFRVSSPDATPVKSLVEISDAFFGTAGDQNSLSSRFAACSFKQLQFVPGTGTNFKDGVAEIEIDTNIVGEQNLKVQAAVTKALVAKYGGALNNEYDHVVYVLPHGTTLGYGGTTRWLSYSFLNTYLSVFNDENAQYISNQVHEIGSNLGVMSSNHGSKPFGDQSGLMGFGYAKEDFPRMCFNAAKSWYFGWYADKSIEVTMDTLRSSGGIITDLGAFIYYDILPQDETVLIKVDTNYLIYNLKKGINDETQEFADTVTISSAPSMTARRSGHSNAMAALGDAGQSYSFTSSDGMDTTMELCDFKTVDGLESATVAIYPSDSNSPCRIAGVDNEPVDTDGLSTFECILYEIVADFDDDSTEYEHACLAMSDDGEYDLSYSIDDNNGVIVTELGEHGYDILRNSGRFKIIMTRVVVESEPVVSTTPYTEVTVEDLYEADSRRRLGLTIGTRTVAVFRINLQDAQVSRSASEIADDVFGVNGDVNNLVSRYDACSMGQLKFIPGTASYLKNGVGEIDIAMPADGTNVMHIITKVTQGLIDTYQDSMAHTYDHVMYVMPRGSTLQGKNTWLAFAYMNSYLGVYNDDNIMYVSNQVHETGHNLGLMHSREGSNTYGDQSGTMGYGYGRDDFPEMCFNGAKSWQLGWYQSKSKEVNPQSGPFTCDLSAFADYKSLPNDGIVLLKVDTNYILFNKAKGINKETQEFANTVTITEMKQEGDFSDHLGALRSPGETYKFSSRGDTVVIELCSLGVERGVDYAKLSIYRESTGSGCWSDAVNRLSAWGSSNNNTPASTPQTPRPTPAPTRSTPGPTPPPTPQTPRQTPRPTPRLTLAPTPQTPRQTPSPTSSETPEPTLVSCGLWGMKIDITIHTDSKPEETSWYLRRRRGATYGVGGNYDKPFHTYTHTLCANKQDTVEFHLSDTGGDGLQPGQGWYTLAVDDKVVHSGGAFGSEEIDYVTGPCKKFTDKRVQFVLNTGSHPETVTWSIKSDPGDIMDYTGGPWDDDSNVEIFTHLCLPAWACYTISVMSSGGLDGGNYEVSWDLDVIKFSTFNRGDYESISFGDGC